MAGKSGAGEKNCRRERTNIKLVHFIILLLSVARASEKVDIVSSNERHSRVNPPRRGLLFAFKWHKCPSQGEQVEYPHIR